MIELIAGESIERGSLVAIDAHTGKVMTWTNNIPDWNPIGVASIDIKKGKVVRMGNVPDAHGLMPEITTKGYVNYGSIQPEKGG